MTERIVAAAIKHATTGVIYSVPAPGRHNNVIGNMVRARAWNAAAQSAGYEGFLTDTGRFVDRAEAVKIADAAGQLRTGTTIMHEKLSTEDVW